MSRPTFYMVFDVESVGLHGEGFAVGWVVIDGAGRKWDRETLYACNSLVARGTPAGRDWLKQNLPDLRADYTAACESLPELRGLFWDQWQHWRAKGAYLAADCAWPVEANFLRECHLDRPEEREWQGPYPLIDIASVRFAAGLDPLAECARLPSELPVHNPLADARQSARLLVEALALIKSHAKESVSC